MKKTSEMLEIGEMSGGTVSSILQMLAQYSRIRPERTWRASSLDLKISQDMKFLAAIENRNSISNRLSLHLKAFRTRCERNCRSLQYLDIDRHRGM
jgi:hypothetical protein